MPPEKLKNSGSGDGRALYDALPTCEICGQAKAILNHPTLKTTLSCGCIVGVSVCRPCSYLEENSDIEIDEETLIVPKRVFVFGSNEGGIHGAGAAKVALEKYGMPFGKSYGHYGDSFAIPTKDEIIETLPIEQVKDYITGFLAYARGHRHLTFQVTRIGCGLAGFKDRQIAPLFLDAPKNCLFDEAWKPWLGDGVEYWGTY